MAAAAADCWVADAIIRYKIYMTKILLNSQGFVIQVTFFHIIVFPKSAVKNTQCYQFLCKGLKAFP